MRQEYVKLIRDFLTKNPQYIRSLPEVKKDVLNMGATEEEFQEALNQLDIPQMSETPKQPQKPSKFAKAKDKLRQFQNQPGTLKKLVEVDIITHVAVGVVVLIPFLVWTITLLAKHDEKPYTTKAEALTSTSFKQTEDLSKTLIPRVYATTDKIDAARVFSFPASNITLSVSGKPKKEVYGFFPYWMLGAQDKVGIDTLTTIGLFGLEVDGKGNIVTANNEGPDQGWAMWNDPQLDKFIARARKKRIRLELTMKAFDKTNIENLVTSDEAQKVFISNVLHLVNLKSLDGINLDFEYIGKPPDAVTAGFTRLVTNLNTELKRQIPKSTLTVDTYINAASIPGLFDVELLSQQADALILMGYDIHTPKGDPGPVAPLDGPVSILGFLQSYLEKVTADKIILAVPYYGYDWPVKSDGSGSGEPGRTLPYAEIAEVSKGKTILWDETGQSPYYRYIDAETNTQRTVYFENIRSLGAKYDLINKKDLKGMGIWALGYDGLNNDLSSLIIEKFAN